jgi:N-carbamoyl-L-amino-acid hydrolase
LQTTCDAVAKKRGVLIRKELVNADPPTTCDAGILSVMEAAALEARYRFKRMVARAYHDSSFVACIAPVAMLFIPCRGGVSHRPDEFASREWIGAGVDVLARTLAQLAS